jgi:hypothetical protein
MEKTKTLKESLWNEVMKLGREREHGTVNKLTEPDIETICGTLDFFGVERPLIQQTVLDLHLSRYRVFDWLAMNLDREMNMKEKSTPDDSNVWVALGITYIQTSAVQQFINSLRYNDYQLWEGKFTSKELAEYIRTWDRDDVENEKQLREEAKAAKRV